MPCGCFINCKQNPGHELAGELNLATKHHRALNRFPNVTYCLLCVVTVKKRRFEFRLSFQQGYGVYKLSHAPVSHNSPPLEIPACHNLFTCDFPNTRLDGLESGGLANLGPGFDLSATCPVNSSSHTELLLEAVAGGGEGPADCPSLPHENLGHGDDFCCTTPLPPHQDHNLTDTSSVFEGTERRLSHEDCRKIELTDWEWCRSKSERTPRQVHRFPALPLY